MERTAKTIKPVMKLLQITLIGLFLLTEALSQVMPEDFRNLAIGMTWKELMQARPDATLLDFVPNDSGEEFTADPEEPRDGLVERISTGPIKFVIYGFNDGRLSAVSFTYSSKRGINDSLLREFLERYGKHENILGSTQTGHGIVKWNAGNLNLYLVLPFENAENQDEFGAYQIMNMEATHEFEEALNVALRKKPRDEIGLQAFKSRVQALSNSILTQETQKPVVATERTPELEPTEQRKLQPKPATKFIFGDESDQQVSDKQSNTLTYVLIGLVIITVIAIVIIVKAHKQ